AVGGVLFAASAATTAIFVPRYLASSTSPSVGSVASAAPRPAPVVDHAPAPPAPSAEQPAQPAPIEPAKVASVTLASTPPGAKVFRAGETVPLGTTPFTATLPADHAFKMRFELAGYQPFETEVDVASTQDVAIKLVK